MISNKQNKLYLGFDYGTSNIGVAVGQSLTMTATPLQCLHSKHGQIPWGKIADLIATWQPTALLVGIPINLEGVTNEITKKARRFKDELAKRFALPAFAADERLTTKSAREIVYAEGGYKALQKEEIDSVAAKLILEAWLREEMPKLGI